MPLGKAGPESRVGDRLPRSTPWKLAPRQVMIAAGLHAETLKPSGAGSSERPVVITFLPGRHEFGVEAAVRRVLLRLQFLRMPHRYPNHRHPAGQCQAFSDSKVPAWPGIRRPISSCWAGLIEILNDHAGDVTYTGLTCGPQATDGLGVPGVGDHARKRHHPGLLRVRTTRS